MVADVRVIRLTGAGPTETDITSGTTRSSLSDDPNPGSTNPLLKPVSGTHYAFWVSTRLKAVTSPDGTISNIRWYADGANNYGTGVNCNGRDATGYVEALGTVGVAGTILNTTNYPGLAANPTNVFSHTAGSPRSIPGSLTNPDTGFFGSLFVYQHSILSTCVTGVKTAETFTWAWDET